MVRLVPERTAVDEDGNAEANRVASTGLVLMQLQRETARDGVNHIESFQETVQQVVAGGWKKVGGASSSVAPLTDDTSTYGTSRTR